MKPAFVYALLIHAALFTVGDTVWVTAPRYGVETGGGIEVNLIAAPSRPQESVEVDGFIQKEEEASPVKADTGKDSITIQSKSGAWTQAAPSYLKNPPPRYPESSRLRGEEGTVWVLVKISKEGRPLSAQIKKSSGFPELDRAAGEAIERWRFLPARIGAINVESEVQIPVRFEIE